MAGRQAGIPCPGWRGSYPQGFVRKGGDMVIPSRRAGLVRLTDGDFDGALDRLLNDKRTRRLRSQFLLDAPETLNEHATLCREALLIAFLIQLRDAVFLVKEIDLKPPAERRRLRPKGIVVNFDTRVYRVASYQVLHADGHTRRRALAVKDLLRGTIHDAIFQGYGTIAAIISVALGRGVTKNTIRKSLQRKI
ncbi:hypothetical protein ACW73L_15965 [Methylolobus aquaticus]